jgi:NADPH:quinone reductase
MHVRAVIAERLGGPDVLKLTERDTPEPGPGQLLVDVAAAGVNFADIYRRQGNPPYPSDVPYGAGMEGAGTVAAVGPGVDGPGEGARVAWTGAQGSYAEQVIVPADRAVPVPDGVDLEVAAAVVLQGMTAHYLSHDTYPIAAGDPVVVHAAAGGVGLLLTQMAKMRGGVVIATTSTPQKAELARAGDVRRQPGRAAPPRLHGAVRRGQRAGAAAGSAAPEHGRVALPHPAHAGELRRDPCGAAFPRR